MNLAAGSTTAKIAAAFLLACALMASGCSEADGFVDIRVASAPQHVCPNMRFNGVLIADPEWGVAVRGRDSAGNSHNFGVVWPHGFSAIHRNGHISLVDSAGLIVARVGEGVELDAFEEDPLRPCSVHAPVRVYQS